MTQKIGDVATLRQAWARYTEAGEECRLLLEDTDRFRNHPELRSQAYATLAEAQAMAYNFAVQPVVNGVNGDYPEAGWHTTWHHNLYHLGQSVQDFQYGGLFLDGRKTYRMTGRIGNARLLLLQVHNHLNGHPASEEIGNYDFHQAFELGDDGSFDVILSATPHTGNWIELSAESDHNALIMRRILGDWNDDRGEMHVQIIDQPADLEPMGDDPIASALFLAADFMVYLTKVFTVGLYDTYIGWANGQKNAWAAMPGANVATELIGSRSTTYCSAIWELESDEALIIEGEVPDSAYWGFQLGDVWSRPLDFIHHQTDLNMQRATLCADGRVRAVLALKDPGIPNWLDPCGNDQGTLVFRNYRSTRPTNPPLLTKVKLADLMDHLPSDTPRITPDERAAALAYRRSGVMRMMGH
ncbi:MAG TPA: DUF1214 domain-containing protein [Propionibacteriaceae bacterium]